MPGVYLSEAFAKITGEADAAQFRAAANQAIKAGLSGVQAQVQMQLGTDRAKAEAADLRDQLKTIIGDLSGNVRLDTTDAQLKFAQINAAADRLDKRLSSEHITLAGVDRAQLDLLRLQAQSEKLQATLSDDSADTGLTELGGDLGKLSNYAMPALIAAAVSLSPVILTLGAGLAGFGGAAVGVLKPVETAATATGGLRANMDTLDPAQQRVARGLLGLESAYGKFSKSLTPEVLGAVNTALSVSGKILDDIQPVAAATGKSFDQFFAEFGATLQDPQWKQFWAFMAATAPQDMQLLGNVIISLTNDLPVLAEDLQPVAVAFLKTAAAAGVITGDIGALFNKIENPPPSTGLGKIDAAFGWLEQHLPAGNKSLTDLVGITGREDSAASHAAGSAGKLGAGLSAATVQVEEQKAAVTGLTGALSALSGGLLATQADEVTWKQAQQAAKTAVDGVNGSLDTNKAKALAARAAIIQSTQAALALASQEASTDHNTAAASKTILGQIGFLETFANRSKTASAELDALWKEELKLQGGHITIDLKGTGKINLSATGAYIQGESGHITAYAAGTPGAARGWGVVGERGPELVKFHGGEQVVPNHMIKGRYAGGTPAAAASLMSDTAKSMAGTFGAKAAQAFTSSFVKALGAATGPGPGAYHSGAGVQQWASVTAEALRLSGARASVAQVLYQMQTESGGNPYAVNKSDINWQLGHPSVGLMQVIKGTFDEFAGRFRNTGPFAYGVSESPLPNIYAAIKYAEAVYGPTLMANGNGLGSGHGYDSGGWLMPGTTLAHNNTGQPEWVSPPAARLHRAGTAAAPQPIVLHLRSSGSGTLDSALMTWLKKQVVITGGGSVQIAFGSGNG